MTKSKAFIKKYKKYLIALLTVLVLVLAFVALGKGKNSGASYLVEKRDVEQSVILSGKVQTSDRADLGFAAGGRIARIYVKNNQTVRAGAVLAQLEISDLLADLRIKELNSSTSTVSLDAAKANLEKVTMRENTKVDSAYRTLISKDLVLVPESNDYGVEPPTVTGIYNGPTGQYKVTIEKENPTSLDTRVRTFTLENTTHIINEVGSTPLGSHGLYISFPSGEFDEYEKTTWYLDIPNKASSSYLANYNAYNEAKDERDLAIKEAESKYEELLSEQGNDGGIAEAEIQKIRAEIRKNTIYAPFNGKVTNIEKEVGENASMGERVISILGEQKLEVVLQVSELDVSKMIPGAKIKINLDAFPGEDFEGTLSTVNSRDTTVEGVPVYEAFVELKPDPRIKTGMSAKGTIILETKHDVVAIPSYLIKKDGTTSTVSVVSTDGKISERTITTGLFGTDSMVEITSGLEAGEKISDSGKK